MKINNTKIFIPILIGMVVLSGVYIYYIHHNIPSESELTETPVIHNPIPEKKVITNLVPVKSNYVLPDTLKEKGITDVFQAKFYSKLQDPKSNKESGQRFIVFITGRKMGNTPQQGLVVINDSTNKLDLAFSQKGILHTYRFYVSYDMKNNWYNLVESELQYSSIFGDGDQ